MIALDTNVLVRYIAQDGGKQADIATQIIEAQLSEAEPGFVSLPVICELVWTLRTRYKRSRNEVGAAIMLLMNARQLVVDQQDVIAKAINDDRADIVDAIIHLIGQSADCTKTVTFDRQFARLPGVELL